VLKLDWVPAYNWTHKKVIVLWYRILSCDLQFKRDIRDETTSKIESNKGVSND